MHLFDFYYRNPGHWDISDASRRLARIRGENGNFVLLNDPGFKHFEEGRSFKTLPSVLAYVAETLMLDKDGLPI